MVKKKAKLVFVMWQFVSTLVPQSDSLHLRIQDSEDCDGIVHSFTPSVISAYDVILDNAIFGN
jgi:hypothetical protein